MGGIFGVTGTPGTGKKSVSPLVAESLGLRCVSLNELARAYGLLGPGGKGGEVDTSRMRRKLAGDVTSEAVLYGHLLPYVLEPSLAEKVFVLRCEPAVLKRRLVERRYPRQKVTENVEAELIGVVSADAFDAFGSARTFEFDTTDADPGGAAEAIGSVAKGEAGPGPRLDWTRRYDSGAKLRSLLS